MPARKGPAYVTIWQRAIGIAPGLTPATVKVAITAVARFYSNDGREFYLALNTAVALSGVSKSAVQRAIAALTAAGWLVRTRPPWHHDAAYYSLAIPAEAMDVPDPITRKTPRQALRTAGLSGQNDHPLSSQDDHRRVVNLTRQSGQDEHLVLNNPGISTQAERVNAPDGATRPEDQTASNWTECVRCGFPAPLGQPLCAKCATEEQEQADAATPRDPPATNGHRGLTAAQRRKARQGRYRRNDGRTAADVWADIAEARALR